MDIKIWRVSSLPFCHRFASIYDSWRKSYPLQFHFFWMHALLMLTILMAKSIEYICISTNPFSGWKGLGISYKVLSFRYCFDDILEPVMISIQVHLVTFDLCLVHSSPEIAVKILRKLWFLILSCNQLQPGLDRDYCSHLCQSSSCGLMHDFDGLHISGKNFPEDNYLEYGSPSKSCIRPDERLTEVTA